MKVLSSPRSSRLTRQYLSSANRLELETQEDFFYTVDGHRLRGEWVFGNSKNPPLVGLLIPGSGNVGLDGDVSGPLLGKGYRQGSTHLSIQLAYFLRENNIASFRYEKRGFQNSFRALGQNVHSLKNDVLKAIDHIRMVYPAAKIALIGFSEGAILSAYAASEKQVDGLFLMSYPTRPLTEVLHYQCKEWPIQLLKNQLATKNQDKISAFEFVKLSIQSFPLLGSDFSGAPWNKLDQDQDGHVSISQDLMPAYERQLKRLLALMKTEHYQKWFQSFEELPSIQKLASQIQIPTYFYVGEQDAQVDPKKTIQDAQLFPCSQAVRTFPGLGHCLSPYEGKIGEIKTAGPLNWQFLLSLRQDLEDFLQSFK